MKTIFIENDIASFEDFHDSAWLEKTFNLDGSPVISENRSGNVSRLW